MEGQLKDMPFLGNVDISSDVLTLRELCDRRKLLFQKKKEILNEHN